MGLRRRGAIRVPGERSGPVAAARRVFAAVGRGQADDVPAGWQCFGVLPDGRKIYGRPTGPPRYWRTFDDFMDEFTGRR